MKKEAEPVTETQAAVKAAANASWEDPGKSEKRVMLTVHKPEGDPSTEIFIGVNFRSYQIQFGQPVEVSADVVEAIKNTTMTTVVQDAHTEKLKAITRPRFAYSTEAV